MITATPKGGRSKHRVIAPPHNWLRPEAQREDRVTDQDLPQGE